MKSISQYIFWAGVAGLPLVFSPAEASLTTYRTAVTSEAALISYYTFDAENPDDSNGANNGTAAGTVAYGQGVGKAADKALLLTGSGHIDLGTSADFDFSSGSGTVEAWVRADWSSITYSPAIFADRDDGFVNWSIHMTPGKDQVGLWNGVSFEPQALPGGSGGTNWHHLAVVFGISDETGENTFSVYWDGKFAGSTTQFIGGAPEAPTEIGSSSLAGAESWSGAIDEVAFYNEALTAEQIKVHYDAFLVGEAPVILLQPAGGAFLPGIPLTLSVEVKGAGVSYQWSKDGTPISGATSATYVLPSLSAGDAGSYTVVASNTVATVTSDTAQIAIGSLSPKLARYQDAVREESSLVSYYTFDAVNANDSKSSNNGTLEGAVRFPAGIGGDADKALGLDGSSHVNLGIVDAFNFSGGVGTIEAWIRAGWTNPPGYNPAIFVDRNGGPVNWSIHMNQGKDAAGMWNGSTYEPQATPGTGTSWHHLAVVFDNSTGDSQFKVYWDGLLAGTTLQLLGPSPEAPTQIGAVSPGGGEAWIGGIDEVAFYSEALSDARIQAHYSAFVQGEPPVITTQPSGGRFFPGMPLTLSLGASGLDLVYQWYKDAVEIPGATSATFSIASLDATTAGTYYARVTNSEGSAETTHVTVAQITPNLTAYKAAVLSETNLVSLYTFDSSNPTDAKGSHDGTEIDTPAYGTGVGGGSDQALVLDGSGHIDLGQVDDFNFTPGQGTVEAWIRADWTENPGYNPAIFADRDGGPVNWSLHMNSGKEAAGLWNGSTYSPLPILNTGTSWHHYAAVFGTNSAGTAAFTLYWDGQSIGTTGQTIGADPMPPTELGSSAIIGAERWIGALDEVAFYRSALTAEAIAKHYAAFVGSGGEANVNPRIQVSRAGTQITVTWPVDATGFVLETSGSLPATTWTPVQAVTGNSATLNASSGTAFYRLRKP